MSNPGENIYGSARAIRRNGILSAFVLVLMFRLSKLDFAQGHTAQGWKLLSLVIVLVLAVAAAYALRVRRHRRGDVAG